MPSLLKIIMILAILPLGEPFRENKDEIRNLLNLAHNAPVEEFPDEKITRKGEVLLCSGDGTAAKLNNQAAALIGEEKYREAITLLSQGLKADALFLPFRYNLGVAYYFSGELNEARLHFNKARDVAPFYSKSWIQIGNVLQRQGKYDDAIYHYREALRRNKSELDTFVAIGDIYFNRSQLKMADRYFEAALSLNPLFPNALIGKARVLFREEKYIQAIVLLRKVETTGDYDKSLHYYYAESSFKLKDYDTAAVEYQKLLRFRNDPFFLTFSRSLIEHKLNLSLRLKSS